MTTDMKIETAQRVGAVAPLFGSYADCAHALVCADWVMRFREACDKAGGGSWETVKRMTVEDAMHLLAPNGIRFCYDDAAHIKNAEDAAAAMSNALQFLPNTSAHPRE